MTCRNPKTPISLHCSTVTVPGPGGVVPAVKYLYGKYEDLGFPAFSLKGMVRSQCPTYSLSAGDVETGMSPGLTGQLFG